MCEISVWKTFVSDYSSLALFFCEEHHLSIQTILWQVDTKTRQVLGTGSPQSGHHIRDMPFVQAHIKDPTM